MSKSTERLSLSEETAVSCVVCCQHVSNNNKKWIYAIGCCDHSVCYECSTRMRVLCKQKECPICRTDLNEVVFTRDKHKKFEELDLKKCIYRNDYGICFEDEDALESYGKLLEHPCRRCRHRQPFKSITDLSTHLRKEHELFMCDLCVANLKVFSNERKYYTRKELARHRKSGDPDERSHRGHPICTFCDERYVDEDDLLIHLRREHYYCHFCDPSGLNHFYGDYSSLRDHFQSDHYLCEECDNLEEKFTCAFRGLIDLQAHIAQIHSQNMSKSDLKKAKTLQLDLFIHQRSGTLDNGQQNKRQMKREQQRQQRRDHNNRDNDMDSDEDLATSAAIAAPVQPPRPEDFPSLCTNATTVSNANNANNSEVKEEKTKSGKKPNTYSVYLSKNRKPNTTNVDEFPALPGANRPQNSVSNSITYNKLTKQKAMNSMPSTAQTSGVQKSLNLIDSSMVATTPTKPKQSSNKPLINNKEEFPSLPFAKKKSSKLGQSSAKINNNIDSKRAQTVDNWSNSSQIGDKNSKTQSNGNKMDTKSKPFKTTTNFEEFPVLEVNPKKSSNSFTAIPSKPVPKHVSKPKATNPPPGLPAVKKSNISLSSVAQQVISTSGADSMQCFDTNCYINAIDFNERNQRLVKEVENVLDDRSKFDVFKETSKQFRQSVISGEQYYQKCIELFGRKDFSTIFSELLVLLPDIGKQNELYETQLNFLKNTSGAIPKKNGNEFIVCNTCGQILISKDESQHMSAHHH